MKHPFQLKAIDLQSSNMDVDSQLSQRKTTDLRAHMGEIEKLTTEMPEHHSKLKLKLPICRALKRGEM